MESKRNDRKRRRRAGHRQGRRRACARSRDSGAGAAVGAPAASDASGAARSKSGAHFCGASTGCEVSVQRRITLVAGRVDGEEQRLRAKVDRAFRRMPDLDFSIRRTCFARHAQELRLRRPIGAILTSPPRHGIVVVADERPSPRAPRAQPVAVRVRHTACSASVSPSPVLKRLNGSSGNIIGKRLHGGRLRPRRARPENEAPADPGRPRGASRRRE